MGSFSLAWRTVELHRPGGQCETSASFNMGAEPEDEFGESLWLGHCPGGQEVHSGERALD